MNNFLLLTQTGMICGHRSLLTQIKDLGNMWIICRSLSYHLRTTHIRAQRYLFIRIVCACWPVHSHSRFGSVQYTHHALILDKHPFSMRSLANMLSSWTNTHSVCALRSHPGLIHSVCLPKLARSHLDKRSFSLCVTFSFRAIARSVYAFKLACSWSSVR